MASDPDDLVLLPLYDVLRTLRDECVHVDILTPPYPCAGIGELRVVRVESGNIVATYQNFERLGGRER